MNGKPRAMQPIAFRHGALAKYHFRGIEALADMPRHWSNSRASIAHVAGHPDTRLKPSGYYHTIGFNFGIVGLTRNAPLLDQVDDAIAALVGSGELAAIAQATRVTFLPPREPNPGRHHGCRAAQRLSIGPRRQRYFFVFARSIDSTISRFASAASPQPSTFTHLPVSRSL